MSLTRGSCAGCHRVVLYATSAHGGDAEVFEAAPGGPWRPAALNHGPMTRVGTGRGSYALHACPGERSRPAGEPIRLVAPVAQVDAAGSLF